MITASVVNGIVIPSGSRYRPTRPKRPKVSSKATPATTGGNTIGKVTNVSNRLRPRNCMRASTNATGKPKRTVKNVLILVVRKLNSKAWSTSGCCIVAHNNPGRPARPYVAHGEPLRINGNKTILLQHVLSVL